MLIDLYEKYGDVKWDGNPDLPMLAKIRQSIHKKIFDYKEKDKVKDLSLLLRDTSTRLNLVSEVVNRMKKDVFNSIDINTFIKEKDIINTTRNKILAIMGYELQIEVNDMSDIKESIGKDFLIMTIIAIEELLEGIIASIVHFHKRNDKDVYFDNILFLYQYLYNEIYKIHQDEPTSEDEEDFQRLAQDILEAMVGRKEFDYIVNLDDVTTNIITSTKKAVDVIKEVESAVNNIGNIISGDVNVL